MRVIPRGPATAVAARGAAPACPPPPRGHPPRRPSSSIDDPARTSEPGLPGDVGLGERFAFPFQTIESVQVLGPRRIVAAGDDNLPFSEGRRVGAGRPDDDEIVTLRLDRARQRGRGLKPWPRSCQTDHVGLPLSVLDLTPVPSGTGGAQALRNTVDLARAAEGWGYARHWLAEHHNTPGMACPSPELMIGQVAGATERIRVGAGGVMLPNHSPLRIAEAFRLLEALYPGRIDLGLGRAPGTDPVTAFALRRNDVGADDFPGQLAELVGFAGAGFSGDHPYARVRAEPADVPLPPIWILASSDYGARVAAALGTGLAFARHLNPRGAEGAIALYRESFSPSVAFPRSQVILAASVVCADTPARAETLVASMGLAVVQMRQGRSSSLPSPEEAEAHAYTPPERDQLRRYRRAQVVGDPAVVRQELGELVGRTGADELMVMTMVHDHAERLRSYELVAESLAGHAERAA